MPRGGKRTPKNPAPVSGPGRFSKRTDGKQPVASPGLKDPSVQYGDVQQLEAAQSMSPAPDMRSRSAGRAGPRAAGEARGQHGSLPSFLFDLPSARGGEPGSTGLPMGPGPGPEALEASQAPVNQQEQVLEYLVQNYGNQDAAKMLAALREERAVAAPTGGPQGAPVDAVGPPLADPLAEEQGVAGGLEEGAPSGAPAPVEPATEIPGGIG